jgi:hypothetical protein
MAIYRQLPLIGIAGREFVQSSSIIGRKQALATSTD